MDMLKSIIKSKAVDTLSGPLPNQSILNHLLHPQNVQGKVPNGPKENLIFIVENTKNVDSRAKGKKSEFFDDCGIWKSKSTSTEKLIFLLDENNEIERNLREKDGKFGLRKMVDGHLTFEPFDPHLYYRPVNDTTYCYNAYFQCDLNVMKF